MVALGDENVGEAHSRLAVAALLIYQIREHLLVVDWTPKKFMENTCRKIQNRLLRLSRPKFERTKSHVLKLANHCGRAGRTDMEHADVAARRVPNRS